LRFQLLRKKTGSAHPPAARLDAAAPISWVKGNR
jgi:hypothetical protein